MFVAWHLKGAAGTPRAWMRLSNFDRSLVLDELDRLIEEHNAAFETE